MLLEDYNNLSPSEIENLKYIYGDEIEIKNDYVYIDKSEHSKPDEYFYDFSEAPIGKYWIKNGDECAMMSSYLHNTTKKNVEETIINGILSQLKNSKIKQL